MIFNTSTKKPKLFCIGANKTGTTSIEAAFRRLGLTVAPQRKGEFLLRKWAMRDFEPLINLSRTADAFQDIPFSLPYSYVALDTTFPKSKFILTVRDSPEQWFNSLLRFHTKIVGKQRIPSPSDLKSFSYCYPGWIWEYHKFVYGIDETTLFDREIYLRHYINHNFMVTDYFKNRPDSLLVLNLSEQSTMRKLIEFIGLKYEGQTMPHLNKG